MLPKGRNLAAIVHCAFPLTQLLAYGVNSGHQLCLVWSHTFRPFWTLIPSDGFPVSHLETPMPLASSDGLCLFLCRICFHVCLLTWPLLSLELHDMIGSADTPSGSTS